MRSTNPCTTLAVMVTTAAAGCSLGPPPWAAQYQREMTPVVYATRDIAPGDPLTQSNTAIRVIHRHFYLDDFVASVPIGTTAKTRILPDELLRKDRLDLGSGAAPIPLVEPTPRPILTAPTPGTLVVAGVVLEPGHTIDEMDLFLVEVADVGGEAYLGCHTGRCFTDETLVLGRVVKHRILANEAVRTERLQP